MEQIQIRQPKMPAAQSFIQILGTFLASLFIFIASLFSYIRLAPLNIKQLNPLVALDLSFKKSTLLDFEIINFQINNKLSIHILNAQKDLEESLIVRKLDFS